MIAIVCVLLLTALPQNGSTDLPPTMQQGAPDEAVFSAAEIHNMRDGAFTVAQLMWERGNQTIWTMPNLYALGPNGKVAYGCRALEAIRVIHDLEDLFQNLRGARERLRSG